MADESKGLIWVCGGWWIESDGGCHNLVCVLGCFPMNSFVFVLTVVVMLAVPSAGQTRNIAKKFLVDLESFSFRDDISNVLKPVVCSVCDGLPTCPGWFDWVSVGSFHKMIVRAKMHKKNLEGIYPELMLSHYTVGHPQLDDFVLSPKTVINEFEEVMVCRTCHQHLKNSMDQKKASRVLPPSGAIFTGHLIGEPPVELSELSKAELALVSGARIDCQSYVFFGGCHEQIRGWHTVFRNRVVANVSSLEMLRSSGLKGKIVVVLCGPFTTTQKALVRKQVQVCPAKVLSAFNWLKRNNYLHHGLELPDLNDVPLPILLEEDV